MLRIRQLKGEPTKLDYIVVFVALAIAIPMFIAMVVEAVRLALFFHDLAK